MHLGLLDFAAFLSPAQEHVHAVLAKAPVAWGRLLENHAHPLAGNSTHPDAMLGPADDDEVPLATAPWLAAPHTAPWVALLAVPLHGGGNMGRTKSARISSGGGDGGDNGSRRRT